MPPTLVTIMQHFGYTPAWLEVGIITPTLLLEQWRIWQTSDDQNTEHYRYGAFLAFLELREGFTDTEVEQLVALEDSNGFDLHEVRLIALLHSQKLSPNQRHWLTTRDEWREHLLVQKIVLRQITLETLREAGLPPEIFATVQTSQDAVLHETLLVNCQVTREHLVWLAEFGQTKAIRNRAKEKLKSKKFGIA